VLSCAGRGLWDGLITRPEESYRVSKYDHAEGKGETTALKDPNGYPKYQ
jgi:hypothetical protein